MNIEKFNELIDGLTPDKILDRELMMFLAQLMMSTEKGMSDDMNELTKDSSIYEPFQEVLKHFIPQVFKMRIEKLTSFKFTTNAFWSLCGVMETPGHAVIYAYYLKRKFPENTLIDMDKLYNLGAPFAQGYLTDEQLNEIWEAQKVDSNVSMSEYTCIGAHDNMLDYLEFWK